jgi:hypothetical protein
MFAGALLTVRFAKSTVKIVVPHLRKIVSACAECDPVNAAMQIAKANGKRFMETPCLVDII